MEMQKRMGAFEGVLCCYPASVEAFGTAEAVKPDQSTPVGEGICLKKTFEPGLHLTPINVSRARCWHVEGCWSRWAWQAEKEGKRESASLIWNV